MGNIPHTSKSTEFYLVIVFFQKTYISQNTSHYGQFNGSSIRALTGTVKSNDQISPAILGFLN